MKLTIETMVAVLDRIRHKKEASPRVLGKEKGKSVRHKLMTT